MDKFNLVYFSHNSENFSIGGDTSLVHRNLLVTMAIGIVTHDLHGLKVKILGFPTDFAYF